MHGNRPSYDNFDSRGQRPAAYSGKPKFSGKGRGAGGKKKS